MFLRDQQWTWIELFLKIERAKRGRTRSDERQVFEAILFMLHGGIQWRFIPPKSTVHDYLQLWCQRDAFRLLFAALVSRMFELGRLELDRSLIDATFAAAKGGGEAVGLTKKGKGTRIQIITDAKRVPLVLAVDSASAGEVQMVQQTTGLMNEARHPVKLVGDKAYECDALDLILEDLGIEMISPHCRNRKPESRTQNGRKLKIYKHRWIVERTIAWLTSHRKLLGRHEKLASPYLDFANLGCFMIVLKKIQPCWL